MKETNRRRLTAFLSLRNKVLLLFDTLLVDTEKESAASRCIQQFFGTFPEISFWPSRQNGPVKGG